jgi:hypothetical protein
MKNTLKIELPNHPSEEFSDILDNYSGTFPSSWTYEVTSPWDVDPVVKRDEADRIYEEDMTAEAWVDVAGQVPCVYLNPHFYAESPADDLTDEAERILQDWASATRRELGLHTNEGENQIP